MSFVRNAWYVAGWARDIDRSLAKRTILGDEHLRAFVPVRGAAHANDRRERGSLPFLQQLSQPVENLPSLKPLLHHVQHRLSFESGSN